MSNIVQLHIPLGDELLGGEIDGWHYFIAYVKGRGQCPHKHRDRAQGERCLRRMRRWLDYQDRRADSGLQPDGTIRIYREGPGPRPSHPPW